MKIIIIGPAYPFRGGIADTNAALCKALSAEHDTAIVTFTLQYPGFLFPGKTQYATEEPREQIPIIPLLHSVNPLNWVRTARKINKMSPDLVIVRYWIPFMAPCLGSVARLLKKRTTLIALCDNMIPHEKRTGDKALTRYFIKPFHGFVTLSQTVNSELKTFTDAPALTLPHPIQDWGAHIAREKARKHLQLEPEGKYLLFFGLIRKYKGLDLLLQAMADERLRELNVKLLVAGEFYDPPEVYFRLIEKSGIKDRVIIRNKYIPDTELPYYFSAADLVTQTYRSASQSGVTPIAFHFDCPVLVTDTGGLSETVSHLKTGYVSSKDPSDIAAHIADFYHNNRSAGFIKNIQREKEKYSWRGFAGALVAFYKNIRNKTS